MKTFDHQVQLIGLIEDTDESGFPTEEEQAKEPIFANQISVRSSEFWQAKQSGVKLDLVFEVHSFEYFGEEKLLFEGKEYKIERTYNKGDLTEMYCSRRDVDHGA
ncbi:SPP1 family predicted phage head-tail adaptor [Salirhabdus euzebyi]|uniref:SPP1 family predicted phage head-tail adaptor n=1 Tax=Salirhabdus euzebyi TaxID=394506 RepID=A0A841PSP7_9BACI|nr:phage head closure protein [Salirhabdus euzebyi]MBB6451987.1 SPP1 family predicted phage head-tail adaptor [Salirhabdus euzebyi]